MKPDRIPEGLTPAQLAKREHPAAKIPGGKRCRYCLQQAQLLYIGQAGYPYRSDYGPVWRCVPCDAHVGCHDGSKNPLGGLATAQLRQERQAAHAVFDPIWRDLAGRGNAKGWARRQTYAWLAEKMGIHPSEAHIGHMDVSECRRVVEICNQLTEEDHA